MVRQQTPHWKEKNPLKKIQLLSAVSEREKMRDPTNTNFNVSAFTWKPQFPYCITQCTHGIAVGIGHVRAASPPHFRIYARIRVSAVKRAGFAARSSIVPPLRLCAPPDSRPWLPVRCDSVSPVINRRRVCLKYGGIGIQRWHLGGLLRWVFARRFFCG